MVRADRRDFTESGEGLTAFASDLGLPPGEWPDQIDVRDGDEGRLFERREPIWNRGGVDRELGGYEYRRDAERLHLFND